LGGGPKDADEVKAHKYFTSISWDDLYNRKINPPFKPVVKSDLDTNNFAKEFTSEQPRLTPPDFGMYNYMYTNT
jgi:hypothetical protein